MTSRTIAHDFSAGPAPDTDAAIHAKRVRDLAEKINDAAADLDDEEDVFRAMYARGMSILDLINNLDEAIEMARGMRK